MLLEPHISWFISRRRKRIRDIKRYYGSSVLYFTFAIIGCLKFLPQGITQYSDDLYIVKPTPALRSGKEELTTVLLVNNENHGHFTNVRNGVGLLTSTARTFIMEGVTTEYATQVVGTTLDNGRVYAKYLKKSSRVLYDKSTVPSPSVVTRWVGESLQSDAALLPQSHNDLFDGDQLDWQAIDDRLSGNRRHHHEDDFIGNIDYVAILKRKMNYTADSIRNKENEMLVGTSTSSSFSSVYLQNMTSVLKSVPQFGILNENAQKVAVNKALPVGNLSTYTIKLNYEHNINLEQNSNTENDNESLEGFVRSPKLVHKNLMQNNANGISQSTPILKPIILASPNFPTITYYGFADFTTVVGDSVIVFSPSTSLPNMDIKAHITSIKGEATLSLGGNLQQGPNISKVAITVAQDLIQPTLSKQFLSKTVASTTYIKDDVFFGETEIDPIICDSAIEVTTNKCLEKGAINSFLEAPGFIVQSSSSEITLNTQSTLIMGSEILSRPSNEDILRIYNALAMANTKVENNRVGLSKTESSAPMLKNFVETSNVQIFGGATIVFFEDDPFANFVDDSKSKINLKSNKPNLDTSNLDVISNKNTILSLRMSSEQKSSTTFIIEEFTTDFALTSTVNLVDAQSSGNSTTFTNYTLVTSTAESSQENQNSYNLLLNVSVEEIDPNTKLISNDFISTSQVFLTQITKTVASYESITASNDLLESVTEITLQIQPTLEIKEATKYYFKQDISIKSNQIDSSLVNPLVTETLNEYDVRKEKEKAVNDMHQEKNDDNEENKMGTMKVEENSVKITTEQPVINIKKDFSEGDQEEDEKDNEEDEEETSGQLDVEDVDNDDEEIEIIYKTLYTTYTYLTTFFHDNSTSVSTHTKVVTNVVISTLGTSITSPLQNPLNTKLLENFNQNEINPTSATSTITNNQETMSKRYMVPFEVKSLIRINERFEQENKNPNENDKAIEITAVTTETQAIFYTTYTYYTTIFAEGETNIVSHTEIITNIKKTKAMANTDSAKIMSTTSSYQQINIEISKPITNTPSVEDYISEISSSITDMMFLKPNITDLGDLSTITLFTEVRSFISPGNQQTINQFQNKMDFSEPKQQHFSLFEDQISSESDTKADEIRTSSTFLLQTSFNTFTYYTTMYNGDKTNVISRLETLTNTLSASLNPSNGNTVIVPVTYFTTFTYWKKLTRDGQIMTLSCEEIISNVSTPTVVQQGKTSSLIQTDNILNNNYMEQKPEYIELSSIVLNEEIETKKVEETQTSQEFQFITKVLEPNTHYTTYTYYTTSYDNDWTITDSRFETLIDVITSTATLTNNIKYITTAPSLILSSTFASSSMSNKPVQNNTNEIETTLILYDVKKIIDAEGVSTIFFTTEIKPTKNSEGQLTEIISSTSSLLINKEKQKILPTAMISTSQDAQKQYRTGLVRLIEGTRIANRTTTLYQSKVIGTIIDQRYAQIIETTSSFIFEKIKTRSLDDIYKTIINAGITPTNVVDAQSTETIQSLVTEPPSAGEVKVIYKNSNGKEKTSVTRTYTEVESDEGNQTKNNDGRLRYPVQTKKLLPLKTFTNRSRPQFAPKKNSSATIITRTNFTPTITATPALKTINRFSTIRRGSSNGQPFTTPSRRFGRPSKSSIQGLQVSSTISLSRTRFASSLSSNTRANFASSSKRLTGPSFSRPSLFSSAFPPGNSRLRIKPITNINLVEASSTLVYANSEEDKGDSSTQDGSVNDVNSNDNEEEYSIESSRRQNNPLLRLRRPLNKPQGFTPTKSQLNLPPNAVSARRNSLINRSRNSNNTLVATNTATTVRPKPRTFQPHIITQYHRLKPTNSLFPSRNIFGAQKLTVSTNQNKDLSEEIDDDEELIEKNYSEYEEGDDEDEAEDEATSRIRRSHDTNKLPRQKREASKVEKNRSNFRSRFRRPKLASTIQAEPKNDEDEKSESRVVLTSITSPPTSSSQRTRSRFRAHYTGHSSSSSTMTTTATTGSTISSNLKAVRLTRPTKSSGVRAQFTLREKDSSLSTSTQKGLISAKRLSFRGPQSGGNISSRRLPNPADASSISKRRLKSFKNGNTTTTARNPATARNRSPSPSSSNSRSRSSGSSKDNNNVRARARNNYINNNNDVFITENSGTITVTHVVSTDVRIPVVNGKLTEYKQVVAAKTSTEILRPQQYTTMIAANGLIQLVLTREDSSVNYNGATEVTQYILHETPTTTITFTPTTIRGRKTSFSHVLPSTVYSVEQIVSTVQPPISANAPLANILLSQLLLGNVGLPAANPLLGALGEALTQPGVGLSTVTAGPLQPVAPVTEYKTHISTYVTTIYEGEPTVLPVTFKGKKILTTIFDTTAQTITATEFKTDTLVTTPTVMARPQPIVNSLLLQQLLLQQHLQQQKLQSTPDPINPLNSILSSVPAKYVLGSDNQQELEISNVIRGSGHGQIDILNKDDDYDVGSSVYLDDIALQAQPQTHKNGRKKSRKNNKTHKRKQSNNFDNNSRESSIITLYVSGRRPGEFSTVLSTVQVRSDFTQHRRQVHIVDNINDFFNDGSELINEYLQPPPEIILLDGKAAEKKFITYESGSSLQTATQLLENFLGDVNRWYTAQTANSNTFRIFQSSTEMEHQHSSSITIENNAFELNNSVDLYSQHFFA